MSVSPLGRQSPVKEAQQLHTANDPSLDVIKQIDFSNVDPQALLGALDRLHSEDNRQIIPRSGNAVQEEQNGAKLEAIVVTHQSPTQNFTDERETQKKCCAIL